MKVISLNCRNWTRDPGRRSPYFWKERMARMKEMIEREKPDVLCFQEMIFPVTMYIPKEYRRVGFSVSHHIYVRNDVTSVKAGKFRIHWNSAIVEGVRIICVHGHWNRRQSGKLVTELIDEMVGPSVAIGDFNVPIGTLKALGMPMSSREVMGMSQVETFQNYTKSESHGEIDHCFMIGMRPKGYAVMKSAGNMSDHCPIMVEFDIPKGR